ncbi:MAG: serine--tRNA ligase [Thermoplasmata archaeon]|nr:serine--tRNA ligase [Thermoplasmata archaeon]
MDLHLKGRLVLSREADLPDLGDFLAEANGTVLAKGAPAGLGAVVSDHSVEGSEIGLTIDSHEFVRAHDALLRLKNAFVKRYGREQKVGVRGIAIDEYDVTFDIPREPLHEVTLPFVESLTFNGLSSTIHLVDVDEEFLQGNYIDRMISRVREKIEDQYYEGKGEYWKLMWASPSKAVKWDRDPTDAMVEEGWLKQGPTKGKWFLRPKAAAVLRAMERIAVQEILEPLEYQEVIESHFVSFDIWLRTGHLTGSPNELYYAFEPATRDPAAWERFKDIVKITKKVPEDELVGLLKPSMAGLCYAQCPVVYWSFQNQTIADPSLPVRLFERAANSSRYESGGRHGIERVDEFHRIEVVFIGYQEHLLGIREELLGKYRRVFNDILDLEWRMAWVTPFYMQQAGQVGIDDEERMVKGTIDFEAYLPYRGDRETSEWLEFQNLTILGDKFTSAFNVKGQKGELWSGCTGIGLERWTAAFLSQHTIDPENWPDGFRRYLPELPKGYDLL